MASVDPYATCPCGSGQKYKFCCQKVEAYAERAQRLIDSQQYEAALKPLEEGLAKVPDNPWLLTRKAMSHLHLNQLDRAKQALRVLLQAHPNHLSAWVLTTQLVAGNRRPGRGRRHSSSKRSRPASPKTGGNSRRWLHLSARHSPRLASRRRRSSTWSWPIRLGAENDKQTMVCAPQPPSKPSRLRLGKEPLSPRSTRLPMSPIEFRESFQQASGWANEGLWSAAASAFELLSPGSSAGVVADRNRGLCCLWIADHEGAVASLRRYITRTGPTIDAIDLEALCQRIDHPPITDPVEFVQLTLADSEPGRLARRAASRQNHR